MCCPSVCCARNMRVFGEEWESAPLNERVWPRRWFRTRVSCVDSWRGAWFLLHSLPVRATTRVGPSASSPAEWSWTVVASYLETSTHTIGRTRPSYRDFPVLRVVENPDANFRMPRRRGVRSDTCCFRRSRHGVCPIFGVRPWVFVSLFGDTDGLRALERVGGCR